jgi:hypothetical protein
MIALLGWFYARAIFHACHATIAGNHRVRYYTTGCTPRSEAVYKLYTRTKEPGPCHRRPGSVLQGASTSTPKLILIAHACG